jgi:hypothetical protein
MFEKLRNKIPKTKRRQAIEGFVRHRYWYNQGSNSFNWLDDVFPFSKFVLLVGAVSGTSFAFDKIRGDLIFGLVVATLALALRAFGKWFIGRFWHYNDGYDVETQWNKGKVPPQRVELINSEELAEQIADSVASKLATRLVK